MLTSIFLMIIKTNISVPTGAEMKFRGTTLLIQLALDHSGLQ
jgi:hypothetical protein